jgi:predicted glycoside hydrolase/deacetylase ChbG (UPF0249 family)
MNHVIINCDDFGFDEHINGAVVQALECKMLSSVSLLVDAPYVINALDISKSYPELGVGLHINLDQQLLFLNSKFRGKNIYDFNPLIHKEYLIYIRGLIADEIDRQITKALEMGFDITHFDGHHNVHLLPGVSETIIKIFQKFGVSKMRFIRSFYKDQKDSLQDVINLMDVEGVITTEHFVDLSQIMNNNRLSHHCSLEIMVHISKDFRRKKWRNIEFQHLLSAEFKAQLSKCKYNLINFSELQNNHCT